MFTINHSLLNNVFIFWKSARGYCQASSSFPFFSSSPHFPFPNLPPPLFSPPVQSQIFLPTHLFLALFFWSCSWHPLLLWWHASVCVCVRLCTVLLNMAVMLLSVMLCTWREPLCGANNALNRFMAILDLNLSGILFAELNNHSWLII